MRLKHLVTLFLLTLLYGSIQAQQAAAVDSLKKALVEAKTIEEKFFLLENISRVLMNVNQAEAEVYGNQLITMAEESRNRKMMIRAYMSNGIRNGYFKGQKIYTEKAIGHFEKALAIARQERMEDEIGAVQLQLADIYLAVPDKDKALKYITEAFSRINTLKNDSLKVEANIGYGKVYQSRNEKIMSLRHFLTALRLAEEIDATKPGIQKMKAEVMRNSYLSLSGFYNRIEDYDKAIDYYVLAYDELDHIKDRRTPYQRCVDINAIGNLFANKKNYDIAISYFERSIAMADSLKFTSLKMPGYISLLNQYLRLDQPQKAMDYLKSPSGQNLKIYLANFGMSGALDQAYAYVYSELNQFDSARLYFSKALPFFEQKFSEDHRVDLYLQLGGFYKKTGETQKAIEYFLKAKEVSERNGMLDHVQVAAKGLDTLYEKSGNFQLSNLYNATYYQYKDSSEKLNKEKELAQVEAADELQRQERLEREKLERSRRRNNIQYMGITLGIVLLFISLVVLGMFKVSATTIKMIGFFTFLMFFEFIFLIFKKNIYSITHGEPWKDLLFMIGLAALLLPLHHWLEEKVIHYLTSHNRLTRAGHHIKTKLFRRTKEGGL
jgi:tetratricopeptide (TPR) repeat protein